MSSRTFLFASLLALVALPLTGCVNRAAQEQAKRTEAITKDKTVPVKIEPVRGRSIAETLSINGNLSTSDDTIIGAKVSGRLVAVYVKEGDTVSAGQVIARQEDRDLNTQLRQARAQVEAARSAVRQAENQARIAPQRSAAAVSASRARLAEAEAGLLRLKNGARSEERAQAEAQVRAAKTNLEVAKAALDRAEYLVREGAASQRELDQARSGYANALAQYETAIEQQRLVNNFARDEDIRQAEAQVRQAREQLQADLANQRLDIQNNEGVQAARANLLAAEEAVNLVEQARDDVNIRAPFAGRIYGRPAQPGTVLGPGAQVARLVGREGLFFEGEVPEVRISQIQPGMPVAIRVDALNGMTLTGTVAAINPSSESLGRIYKVRITLDSRDADLKNGMFARGTIELGRRENAITVPSAAILRDEAGRYVYLAVDGKAVRRDVKVVGEQDGRSTVEGLSEGDPLVVSGQAQLVPNSVIRIDDGKAPAAEGSEA